MKAIQVGDTVLCNLDSWMISHKFIDLRCEVIHTHNRGNGGLWYDIKILECPSNYDNLKVNKRRVGELLTRMTKETVKLDTQYLREIKLNDILV